MLFTFLQYLSLLQKSTSLLLYRFIFIKTKQYSWTTYAHEERMKNSTLHITLDSLKYFANPCLRDSTYLFHHVNVNVNLYFNTENHQLS